MNSLITLFNRLQSQPIDRNDYQYIELKLSLTYYESRFNNNPKVRENARLHLAQVVQILQEFETTHTLINSTPVEKIPDVHSTYE